MSKKKLIQNLQGRVNTLERGIDTSMKIGVGGCFFGIFGSLAGLYGITSHIKTKKENEILAKDILDLKNESDELIAFMKEVIETSTETTDKALEEIHNALSKQGTFFNSILSQIADAKDIEEIDRKIEELSNSINEDIENLNKNTEEKAGKAAEGEKKK